MILLSVSLLILVTEEQKPLLSATLRKIRRVSSSLVSFVLY